jgi:hypothetical protein
MKSIQFIVDTGHLTGYTWQFDDAASPVLVDLGGFMNRPQLNIIRGKLKIPG